MTSWWLSRAYGPRGSSKSQGEGEVHRIPTETEPHFSFRRHPVPAAFSFTPYKYLRSRCKYCASQKYQQWREAGVQGKDGNSRLVFQPWKIKVAIMFHASSSKFWLSLRNNQNETKTLSLPLPFPSSSIHPSLSLSLSLSQEMYQSFEKSELQATPTTFFADFREKWTGGLPFQHLGRLFLGQWEPHGGLGLPEYASLGIENGWLYNPSLGPSNFYFILGWTSITSRSFLRLHLARAFSPQSLPGQLRKLWDPGLPKSTGNFQTSSHIRHLGF